MAFQRIASSCCRSFGSCLTSVFCCFFLGLKYIAKCCCSFCHYGGDPDDQSEALPPWRILWIEFVNRTTWHGLKYLELRSRFLMRKVIWSVIMLTNFCIFIYISYTKATQLTSFGTSLSLSINFFASLPFPAVTICNTNKYRMTALQQNNLYDLLAIDSDKDFVCDYCDEYLLYSQIWSIPLKNPPFQQINIKETNRHVCMRLCSTVYESSCSGFLYYRLTRICILTSYTGERVLQSDKVDNTSSVEFYRRQRPLISNVSSDFEFESPFVSTLNNVQETWQQKVASSLRIKQDNGLGLGSGHVMNMQTIDERGGYIAELISPFLNISNSCLTLAYWIDLPQPKSNDLPSITVYTQNEELEKKVVAIESSVLDYWKTINVSLTDGIFRIIIVGKRSGSGVNGISIDSVSIGDCSNSKRNCLSNFYGTDYMGTISVDSNNRSCEPWLSAEQTPFLFKLPEGSSNFCRFVPGEGWSAPSCLVKNFDGSLAISTCSIPYCEEDDPDMNTFSCHSNGFTIPGKLRCDGTKDCADGSDEIYDCNVNISCLFTDDFICGYQQPEMGNQKWIHSPISDLAYYHNTLLSRNMSNMADVLVLFSNGGHIGDKTLLVSPIQTFTKPTQFIVTSMLELTYIDDNSGLFIYLLSSYSVPIRTLAHLNLESSSFLETVICIPAGTFGLGFEGSQGLSNDQFVALAYVQINENDCQEKLDYIELSSVNCDFSSLCGYKIYSTTSLYQWSLVPEDDIATETVSNTMVCGATYKSRNGYITSPNYPAAYPSNLNCAFTIEAPASSTVELLFEKFNVESENDCSYDYVQIYSYSSQKSMRFCGSSNPPQMKFNESVQVTFVTDEDKNYAGFKLNYKISKVEGENYMLALTNARNLAYNYNTIKLYSPPASINFPSCLTVRLKAEVAFNVYALHQQKDEEYTPKKKKVPTATLR